jgi:hypothetical protein
LRLQVGTKNFSLKEKQLDDYLSKLSGKKAHVVSLKKLGEGFHNAGFLLTFKVGGKEQRWVMRIVRGDTGWGHDYLGDRAAVLLLQHQLFNTAPKGTCCKSMDVAALSKNGEMVSLRDTVEFFDLVQEITNKEGQPYANDLFRIARDRALSDLDLKRCDTLVEYLARLHSQKKNSQTLYMRHIRDLVGHGEMLMGVIDTYPDIRKLDFTSPKEIERIEVKIVEWRNKIKFMHHRLSRIHGDYHPFGNIRFRKDNSIMALDLAREMFGEPADDVSCLSINYIFFSVWHYGRFVDPFKTLFKRFMEGYLKATDDEEILSVIAPFYAFRGLVVTHPLYYPDMEYAKRRFMFNLIINILDDKKFQTDKIDEYLGI